jgi:hypothetical protein
MSAPNVLVNFRLDRDRPMRIQWLATDGTPGNGYKAQVTAIRLGDGALLPMDSSAIVEQAAPDPDGGPGAYIVTFTGVVGFAGDHPARPRIDRLDDEPIAYDLAFIRRDDGKPAIEGEDYKIHERPTGMAHKVTRRID